MEGVILAIIGGYFVVGLVAVVYGLQFGVALLILAPAIWVAERTGIASTVRRWRQRSPAVRTSLTIIGYILGYFAVWLLLPWLFWYGLLTSLELLGVR